MFRQGRLLMHRRQIEDKRRRHPHIKTMALCILVASPFSFFGLIFQAFSFIFNSQILDTLLIFWTRNLKKVILNNEKATNYLNRIFQKV